MSFINNGVKINVKRFQYALILVVTRVNIYKVLTFWTENLKPDLNSVSTPNSMDNPNGKIQTTFVGREKPL
jgi:hypothetical protein